MNRFRLSSAFLGCALLLAVPLAAANPASDWPQFRGTHGDGISNAKGIPRDWPAEGLEQLWSIPLGGGFSGISAVQGALYSQFNDDDSEHLISLRAGSGEKLWQVRLDDRRRDQFGDGPRATPTVDGDRVYAVSALGNLWCLSSKTGKTIWHHDLRQKFGATVPTWGVSASPIVVGERLLFDVGGKPEYALMAFDKMTGNVLWHSGSGLPGYSLPIPLNLGGIEQVVFFAGTQVVAVDPATGKKIWHLPWKTAYDVNAAAPVFIAPDRIFISSGYDTGAAMLRLSAANGKVEVSEDWRSRRMKNQFSSSVYHQGYLYGFDNKTLKCIAAETGQDMWRKSGFGHGSLFFIDDHLVVLGDQGHLALVAAEPGAYREKARFQPATGKHWTVPTYYDGRLFVRNEKSLMSFRFE